MINKGYKTSVLMAFGFRSGQPVQKELKVILMYTVDVRSIFSDGSETKAKKERVFQVLSTHAIVIGAEIRSPNPHFFRTRDTATSGRGFRKKKKLMRCKVKPGITRNISITFACVITHARNACFSPYLFIYICFSCQCIHNEWLTKERDK